mgnify:FL=1|jgi:hypothetical protein
MSVSLFEIVVLANGEVALQRANDEREPLIRIAFSAEVQDFLEEAKIDVAKVMIDAGIELFEQLGSDLLQIEEGETLETSPRVVH